MEVRSIKRWLTAPLLMPVLLPSALSADTLTYLDRRGETQTVEGRLAGSGQGMHALETPDGRIILIPQGALQEREVSAGPAPLTPVEMEAQLHKEFGEEGIRTVVDGNYVVGLVLAGPLPQRSETQVIGFLKRAATFLNRVERVVTNFCENMRLDAERPKYPQVTLIFESDGDFDSYADEETGGMGLAADRMLGFYSPLTNRLAIRIGECWTFQVPLHEAIHQQVFNRGLLQRLAGVPAWFSEGIATAFENDGERIDIGPHKVNATYARRLCKDCTLSWEEIVQNDAAFTGDVIAGEAYAQAWGLHWTLVTNHRRDYVRYFQSLAQIPPLEEPTPKQRRALFEECFDVPLAKMESDFPRRLKYAIKRQRLRLDDESAITGHSVTYGDASRVELTAVQRSAAGGVIEVRGRLRNVSPFRDFAYYVTVQTTGGLYADWFLPSVGSHEAVKLAKQTVTKQVPGGPGVASQAYWVEVKSALPDGDVVADWKENGFPVPEWKPR